MFNFFDTSNNNDFTWDMLGNIEDGRQHLDSKVPVFVYRLLEYSLKAELTKQFGNEKMIEIFRNAGELAGKKFAEQLLDLSLPTSQFFEHLQTVLAKHDIGILRLEKFDSVSGNLTLTISEDLDCSGLPVIGETVCNYDEGFLKGILDSYTSFNYSVQEIDCWATGSRVCRFEAKVLNRE